MGNGPTRLENAAIDGRTYLRTTTADDGSDAPPEAMIVCLHGAYGTGNRFYNYMGHQFIGTPGLLLLFPDGLFERGWNDGRAASTEYDGVQFLQKMIGNEKSRHPSIRKVCCTGMSNGAMMTFTMMQHHASGLIDCYAPICGLCPKYADGSKLPVHPEQFAAAQVLLIVGMEDRFIPAAGGVAGRRGEVWGLQDTVTALERMLGVVLEEAKNFGAERALTAEERTSDDGRLKIIATREAGHQWPGARGIGRLLPGTGKAPTFSAGEEILRMVMERPT
jgi:poly(3-hydroxybutyrate) depolymerase